jgi:tetratricopeptide (TPR) repeat protein
MCAMPLPPVAATNLSILQGQPTGSVTLTTIATTTSEAASVANLGDIVRGSLIADKIDQIPILLNRVIAWVEKNEGKLFVKNFWSDPKPLSKGYVGVHARIHMPIPPVSANAAEAVNNSPNEPRKYILMELQLHLRAIMNGTLDCAKEFAHRLYKLPEEDAKETASADVISSSQLIYLTSMVKSLYDPEELKRINNLLEYYTLISKTDGKSRLIFETALLLNDANLCPGVLNEKLQALVPTDKNAIQSAWVTTAMAVNKKLNLPVIKPAGSHLWANTAKSVDELFSDALQIAPFFEKMCNEAVEGMPDCSVNFGPGNKHMLKEKDSLLKKLEEKANPKLLSQANDEEEEKQKSAHLEGNQKVAQDGAVQNQLVSGDSQTIKPLSFYFKRLQKQMEHPLSLKQQHPFFTGRHAELEKIAGMLSQKGASVLYGPAGIGKSELAITFANTHLEDYSLIWFIPCATNEEKTTAYMDLASVLKVPFSAGQSTEELFKNVHLKLENMQAKPWLLIYDNAPITEAPSLLTYPQRGGHLLITSLAKHDGLGSIEVPLFSLEDAQKLLTQLTHEAVSNEMNALIKFCGFYPPYLERVGMDIQRIPGETIQNYLKTLTKDADLAQLPLQGRYKKTLEQAILQTTEHLPQPTRRWLQACCYLSPNAIPLTYLQRWLTIQTDHAVNVRSKNDILIAVSEHAIQQLQNDNLAMSIILQKAIALLPRNENTIVQVHELLMQTATEWSTLTKNNWQLAMAQASIWSEHAIYFASKEEFALLAPDKQADILQFLGILKEQQTQLSSALTYLQQALALRPQANILERSVILDYIGNCHYRLNQRTLATDFHQQAEALRKQNGPESVQEKVQGLVNRALECNLDKAEEALALFTQALQIQTQIGAESIEVAGLLLNIGKYKEMLRFNVEALTHYTKANEIAKKTAGDEHPITKKTAFHIKQLKKIIEKS